MSVRSLYLLVFLVASSSPVSAQQNPLSDILGVLGDTLEKTFPQDQQQTKSTAQRTDDYYVQEALQRALETAQSGTDTNWYNPSNGHQGVITPSAAFVNFQDQNCRRYESTITSNGNVSAYQGTACRKPNGVWEVENEGQVARAPSLPAPQPSSVLEQGFVQEAQYLLNQLGYNPGPVDGIMGRQTQAAIVAFQRDQGLPIDGEASDTLLAELRRAGAGGTATIAAAPDTTPTIATAPAPDDPKVIAEQEKAKAELIAAFEELDFAITAKINSDIETTARAFADTYDIEQSRRIADFLRAPLTVIEQAIGAIALVHDLSNIAEQFDVAETVLEGTSLVMGFGHLWQAGEDLERARDGPTYSFIVDEMLAEAASSSDQGQYPDIIALHLFGIGARQGPVGVRHQTADARFEMLWGGQDVKRRISAQIERLTEEISAGPLGSLENSELVLERLSDVTRAIKRSKAGQVTIPPGGIADAGTASTSRPGQLGSIASLESVRNWALGAYDRDLELQQFVVLTHGLQAGTQVATFTVKYLADAEAIAETTQQLAMPITEGLAQSETAVSIALAPISKVYTTSAREEVRNKPYEMVLALPTELLNTWAIVDSLERDIRALLSPELSPALHESTEPLARAEPTTPIPSPEPPAPAQGSEGAIVLKVVSLTPTQTDQGPGCTIKLNMVNNTDHKLTAYTMDLELLDTDHDPIQPVTISFEGPMYPETTSEGGPHGPFRLVAIPCEIIGGMRTVYFSTACRRESAEKFAGECGSVVAATDGVVPIFVSRPKFSSDIAGKDIIVPELGIKISDITPNLRDEYLIEDTIVTGVVVTDVALSDYRNKMVPGDVIRSVGDVRPGSEKDVVSSEEFLAIIQSIVTRAYQSGGASIRLRLLRPSTRRDLDWFVPLNLRAREAPNTWVGVQQQLCLSDICIGAKADPTVVKWQRVYPNISDDLMRRVLRVDRFFRPLHEAYRNFVETPGSLDKIIATMTNKELDRIDQEAQRLTTAMQGLTERNAHVLALAGSARGGRIDAPLMSILGNVHAFCSGFTFSGVYTSPSGHSTTVHFVPLPEPALSSHFLGVARIVRVYKYELGQKQLWIETILRDFPKAKERRNLGIGVFYTAGNTEASLTLYDERIYSIGTTGYLLAQHPDCPRSRIAID